MEHESPPRRPRIEQIGEKIGAICLIIFVLAVIIFFLNRSSPLKFGYMGAAFWTLLGPASLTFTITVASYAAGMGIGFFLGWVRTVKNRLVRTVATGWVEAIRGTPMLVQLLLLFAVLSYYNPGNLPSMSRFLLTGFLAMMINTGAYQAEIFRAGLQSVSAGQVEAAKAVGLGYWGSMRSVILPQAFRIIIPPLTNEFILMLKASALLSVIAVQELTYSARLLSFTSLNLVEVYVVTTILYLIMTLPVAKTVAYLERRYRIPGLGLQQEERARTRRDSRSMSARLAGFNLPSRPDAVRPMKDSP